MTRETPTDDILTDDTLTDDILTDKKQALLIEGLRPSE